MYPFGEYPRSDSYEFSQVTLYDYKQMLLHEKVFLIAGSNNAVGRATAWEAIAAGAKVILIDDEPEGEINLVLAIEAQGGRAIFQQVNVTMSGELDVLFDRINREFGRLDIAFNNFAVSSNSGLLPQLEEGDVVETIDINVYGTWLAMKYEIQQMLTNRGGTIINNSGISSINPQPKKTIESATKAAIASMTKAAALEYTRYGIRINAVAPGFIETNPESNNGTRSSVSSDLVPMGRLGTPQEVAKAVIWLSSNEASFTTGHILAIDGGFGK